MKPRDMGSLGWSFSGSTFLSRVRLGGTGKIRIGWARSSPMCRVLDRKMSDL